jgi:tetratricopeptide (TPR) repeat protein
LLTTALVFLCPTLALLDARVTSAQEAPKSVQEAPKTAQEAPKTEAQVQAGALFSEARKLVEAGDYAQACPKFEQSLRLNVGIGVQFNLADCWEHIGRTASAQALFQGVAASARAVAQVERAQVAQARADALEPRLVRMLIDVRATDPALVVRRNHIVVEQKSWGAATPVDTGEYLIEASAPGKKTWSERVILPVAASATVSITVPALLDAAESPAPDSAPKKEAPKAQQASFRVTPDPLAQATDSRSIRRSGYSYALAGLGVASVGLGTILALEFKSKNDDAKSICPSGLACTQSDVARHAQLISDARGLRTWSFVGFGVGGAALIAGTVLFLAPSSSSARSSLRAAPFVAADGSWGAVASGSF